MRKDKWSGRKSTRRSAAVAVFDLVLAFNSALRRGDARQAKRFRRELLEDYSIDIRPVRQTNAEGARHAK